MSVLAQVLPQILPDLKVEPPIEQNVFDYSTRADFEKLWKFAGLREKRIVIVWTQTAPDPALAPINAADCLSPLDWAAAYVKQLPPSPENWPQILVIDANPQSHLGVPTLAHFHTLRPDQLPWLTVLNHPNLTDLLKWLGTEKQTGNIPALDRFLREIRLNLTDVRSVGDYDRHSISNIVAPMVLLGRAANTTLHAEALYKLLTSCGIAAPADKQDGGSEDAGNGLQFLLLDDQAEHGWADWITTILPGSQVKSLNSPDSIFAALQEQMEPVDSENSVSSPIDLRFSFRLPLFDTGQVPILLLDLRLFAGRWESELVFYKELVAFAEKHFCRSDLGWEGIDAGLLEAITQWLDNSPKAETQGHHKALTLFPRVLALADMSLPIILFSSTGRREITDALGEYGNIVTSFDKPRFFNNLTDCRKTANATFLHAVQTAFWWKVTRESIANVIHRDTPSLDAATASFKGVKHIEIFHDEGDRDTQSSFRLAMLISGYQQDTESDDVDRAIIANNLLFYGAQPPLKKNCEYPDTIEKQWRTKIANNLTTSISKKCVLLPAIVASGESPQQSKDCFSLIEPTSLDNLNWEMLSLLIELTLLDVIPWITGELKLSIHFYGATRNRTIRMRATTESDARMEEAKYDEELKNRWGISGKKGLRPSYKEQDQKGTWWYCWSSLGYEGFHSFVSDAAFQRQHAVHSTRVLEGIKRALGVALTYKTNAPYPPFRHLHYMVDRIVSIAEVDSTSKTVSLGEVARHSPFQNQPIGFAGMRHPDLLSILNCNRCLDAGEVPEAFCIFQNVAGNDDVATDVIARRLQESVSSLEGSDIQELAEMLKAPPAWMEINRIRAPRKFKQKPVKTASVPQAPPIVKASAVPLSQPPQVACSGDEQPSQEEKRKYGMALSRAKLRCFGFKPSETSNVAHNLTDYFRNNGIQFHNLESFSNSGVITVRLSEQECSNLESGKIALSNGVTVATQRAKASYTERTRGSTVRYGFQ